MGKYIHAEKLMGMHAGIVQTARTTPGEGEFFVQTAEREVDGVLARGWNVATFSGTPPPMVETITILLASHGYLRSKIVQEDPNRSDWVQGYRETAEKYLTQLTKGELLMVSGSGTVIAETQLAVDQVWSSTAKYKPTMDLRDPLRQRVSRMRLIDEREADRADSGSTGDQDGGSY